jgi:threonine/homoserine/homoserine lactone efflux protein
MDTSLTLNNIAALTGIMFVGALIPGISVLAVSSRAVAFGFSHGVLTTMGIVVGDIIFILIAILGLSVLAETMGSFFVLVKYLGGAYLVWLGITLWRSKSKAAEAKKNLESSLLSSFLTGLFITLGDQKAIFFYLGFFPAFIELSSLTFIDAGIIILVATLAIVSTKLGYALLAIKSSQLFKSAIADKRINMIAGTVIIGLGVFLVVRA